MKAPTDAQIAKEDLAFMLVVGALGMAGPVLLLCLVALDNHDCQIPMIADPILVFAVGSMPLGFLAECGVLIAALRAKSRLAAAIAAVGLLALVAAGLWMWLALSRP